MSFFFHLFLPDNIKQDAYKTAANSKQITDTLKKISGAGISNIWDNTDGCDGQYRYAIAFYLL